MRLAAAETAGASRFMGKALRAGELLPAPGLPSEQRASSGAG
jgi:hypothetical protein